MVKRIVMCSIVVCALAAQFAAAADGSCSNTTSIAGGATVMKGNSDQLIGNATVLSEWKGDKDVTRLGAEGNYSELNSNKTGETWKVYANYKHLLSERAYAVADATYCAPRTCTTSTDCAPTGTCTPLGTGAHCARP